MKRVLIFLALVAFGTALVAQNKLNAEYQIGYFVDQFDDDGLNIFSPDLNSTGGYGDKEMSSRILLNYRLSDKVNFDFIYGDGFAEGQNDVESYNNNFTEMGVIANVEVYTRDKYTLYVNAGYSTIDFNAERYLVSGSEVPHSVVSDNAEVTTYGAKLKYSTEGCMYLTLSFNVYDIDNDGFDGWDNGTESELLLFRGFGIGCSIN